jgi:glutaredoxin-like protein NrdH
VRQRLALDQDARTNLRNKLTRTITIYTQHNCQPCKATKRWLDKRDIPYTEVDISTSPDDAKAIIALGFKEAPVIIVSTGDPETDIMWSSFHPDNLSKYTHSTKEAA